MGGLETLLRVATTMASLILITSPGADIYRIHKAKSTGEMSILPSVALFGNCYLWILYGCQSGDWVPLVLTSVYGVTMTVIYTSIYYKWSTERASIHKLIGCGALGLAIVTVYVVLAVCGVTNQSDDDIVNITGYIAVAVNIGLYASPLETVKRVVQTKSAVSMPAIFCFAALINCTLWVLTALVDNDMFVLTPNVIGMILAIIQCVLCWMYRPGRTDTNTTAGGIVYDLESGNERAIKSVVLTPNEDAPKSPVVYEAVRSPLAPLQS